MIQRRLSLLAFCWKVQPEPLDSDTLLVRLRACLSRLKDRWIWMNQELPGSPFWFRLDEEHVFVCIHLVPRSPPETLVPCHDFFDLCTIVDDAVLDH